MSIAGPLCAFLSSCSWAVGVSAYSRLARRYPAAAINTTRALIAFPVFLVAALLESGGARAFTEIGLARQAWLAASIVTSYALGDVLFLRATNLLGVPAALSIASTYPLWAAVAGIVFRGEPLSLLRLLGVMAVVAGTVVVIASTRSATPVEAGAPRGAVAKGVLLALSTSLFWAANSVSIGLGAEGVTVAVASTVRMGWALLLCPLIGLVTPRSLGPGGEGRHLAVPWPALRGSLWAFLVEGIGGTILFTYGLRQSPLAVGAALSSLAPVVAVPIVLLLGTERFSAAKTVGIVVVVGGIFLLVR